MSTFKVQTTNHLVVWVGGLLLGGETIVLLPHLPTKPLGLFLPRVRPTCSLHVSESVCRMEDWMV